MTTQKPASPLSSETPSTLAAGAAPTPPPDPRTRLHQMQMTQDGLLQEMRNLYERLEESHQQLRHASKVVDSVKQQAKDLRREDHQKIVELTAQLHKKGADLAAFEIQLEETVNEFEFQKSQWREMAEEVDLMRRLTKKAVQEKENFEKRIADVHEKKYEIQLKLEELDEKYQQCTRELQVAETVERSQSRYVDRLEQQILQLRRRLR